jgi:hypothetical protein
VPHIDLDQLTYDLVKSVAKREGRLLKGVVRLAVASAYGTPEDDERDTEGGRDAAAV